MTDRFTITPDPARAGQPIEICFSNPALAGDPITVGLNNGGTETTDELEIQLDGSGYGCESWTVPATGWPVVIATHPTSDDHPVQVTT